MAPAPAPAASGAAAAAGARTVPHTKQQLPGHQRPGNGAGQHVRVAQNAAQHALALAAAGQPATAPVHPHPTHDPLLVDALGPQAPAEVEPLLWLDDSLDTLVRRLAPKDPIAAAAGGMHAPPHGTPTSRAHSAQAAAPCAPVANGDGAIATAVDAAAAAAMAVVYNAAVGATTATTTSGWPAAGVAPSTSIAAVGIQQTDQVPFRRMSGPEITVARSASAAVRSATPPVPFALTPQEISQLSSQPPLGMRGNGGPRRSSENAAVGSAGTRPRKSRPRLRPDLPGHARSEKARRDRINDLIGSLRELTKVGKAADKGTVLSETQKYVLELKERVSELETRLADVGANKLPGSPETLTDSEVCGADVGAARVMETLRARSDGAATSGQPEVIVQETGPGAAVLHVACDDRSGLLSDLVTTLAASSAEISDARITTDPKTGSIRDTFAISFAEGVDLEQIRGRLAATVNCAFGRPRSKSEPPLSMPEARPEKRARLSPPLPRSDE